MNKSTETIILGGGCFWCLEAIYQQVMGVYQVIPGYAGGKHKNPTYKEVCTGTTGHAEVIQITFNPKIISFPELLEIFFEIHDPTTLNRQGNDVGTQYRSIILATTTEQYKQAKAYVKELEREHRFEHAITTEIKRLHKFYSAENYHQNYYQNHQEQPYCQLVISPKVKKFHKKFHRFTMQT